MYAQTLRLQFTVRFRSELFSVRANMRPEIIAKPTPFNRTVLKKCKMLEQEYKKPTFLFNAHAETLWGSFLRSHLNLNLERKYLSTGDGGVISLDSLKVGMSSDKENNGFVGNKIIRRGTYRDFHCRTCWREQLLLRPVFDSVCTVRLF